MKGNVQNFSHDSQEVDEFLMVTELRER